MKSPLFLALAVIAATSARAASAAPKIPETLKARAVSWDLGWKPASADEWIARAVSEVRDAARERVDVLVLPELFAWGLGPFAPKDARAVDYITSMVNERLLPAAKAAAAPGMLLVLGSYPHAERGASHVLNRAPVLFENGWRFVDKLDPTQGEALEDPPVKPGYALPLFKFRGGLAAVLICFSLEKPELASALKKRGPQLILSPSATEDEAGVARVLRSASGRAVELGAAVLVAPLLGEQDGWKNRGSTALYLPAQKGLELTPRESPRRESGFARDDYELPWKKLLALREQPKEKPETRPFLAPASPFQVEIDGAAVR